MAVFWLLVHVQGQRCSCADNCSLAVCAAGTPARPSRSTAPEAKPATDSAARTAAGKAVQKDQASSSSTATASAGAPQGPAADAAAGEADASARRVSRDTADSHAASDTEAKAAKQDATAAAAEKQKGANGAEGGRSQRTVADFAKEVAALQEENKRLKQALHAQVGFDGLMVAPWLGYRPHALVLFSTQSLQRHAPCAESDPAGQARMLIAWTYAVSRNWCACRQYLSYRTSARVPVANCWSLDNMSRTPVLSLVPAHVTTERHHPCLVDVCHAQARDSNAAIMASFYSRGNDERSLRTVPEEAGGAGSSKTGSGAGKLAGTAGASGEGQGTPTNGSELGVSAHAMASFGSLAMQWLTVHSHLQVQCACRSAHLSLVRRVLDWLRTLLAALLLSSSVADMFNTMM